MDQQENRLIRVVVVAALHRRQKNLQPNHIQPHHHPHKWFHQPQGEES
jgi:hypothetical protein